MPITRNNDDLRFNSGNNFQIKDGAGAWESLGKIMGGKLSQTEGSVPITFSDGTKYNGPGARECSFSIVLGQVSKEIIDRLNQLVGKFVKFYYDNGTDMGSDTMEIFAPEFNIRSTWELDMKGETHQSILIEGSLAPQEADASCIPDTDLPADAVASGLVAIDSNNPFYVILETAG